MTSLCFKTSATDLVDEFAEIHALLDTKKVAWAKIAKLALSRHIKIRQVLEAYIKKPKYSRNLACLLSESMVHWHITSIIGRLGVDITDIHERLANIEKDVKDLKLRK